MCHEFYTARQPGSRDSVVPGWCDGLVGRAGAWVGGYLSGICLAGSGTSLGIKGAMCWVVQLSSQSLQIMLRPCSLFLMRKPCPPFSRRRKHGQASGLAEVTEGRDFSLCLYYLQAVCGGVGRCNWWCPTSWDIKPDTRSSHI